jgi:hypothetical protein
MKPRNKRIFAYSFLLLFMMACRTYACNQPRSIPLATGNPTGSLDVFSCQRFIQLSSDPHSTGLVCKLACPTGTHTFDLYDKEIDSFINVSLSEVQAQYCPGGAPVQQSSSEPQPTEPPTEEPAPTEPPTDEPPLTSILGGRVSYCSMNAGQHYLNLPFNSGADPAQVQQELDNGDLKVVISGTTTEGRCKVLASNNMLLCAFPSSSLPAFSSSAANTILNVVYKGTVIDVLPFNNFCEGLPSVNSGGESSTEESSSGGTTGGSGGSGTTGGSGSGGTTGGSGGSGTTDGSGGGSVPACDPHIDPTCPVDCSNPANADLCG